NGVLEMVATDGRRLSLVQSSLVAKDREFQVIIPTKVLGELLRLLTHYDVKADSHDSILVGVTENQIAFQYKETTILSRLVGGTFPHYEQVIPNKKDIVVLVDAKELLAVTRRASLCAVDRGGSVKYTLRKGELEVASASQNQEFNEVLPIDYQGGEFQVAFNPQFVMDALKHVDSAKVSLGLTTPVNPALLEPEGEGNYRFVVMPMRI
ncbi:MAG: DNA polymerase III subunit beta, partial [Elusimicrobia bacterium]|nr:DNA polymerase III subunit beta [Elusimicrobiota bacterium]